MPEYLSLAGRAGGFSALIGAGFALGGWPGAAVLMVTAVCLAVVLVVPAVRKP